METLKTLFSDQVIEAFGWAIFHSIWQALAILLLLVTVLVFMKNYSARIRYTVSCIAMAGIFLWSVGTGVKAYNNAKDKLVIKERLLTSNDGIAKEIKSILANAEQGIENEKVVKNLKWIEFKSKVQGNFAIVFYLWLIGVFFFLIRITGSWVGLQKLVRQKNAPLTDGWLDITQQLKEKLKIKEKVNVLQSYLVQVPMVIGKLKPVVLIPAELLTGLNEEQLLAILAHELAHIKRNDYIFNIIQSVVETLFFYHPAVWVISRIIRNEREHACDDMAVEVTGDKLNYIKALASAQEFTLKMQYNAVAFAQSNGGLLTRVKRLKTMSNMKNKFTEGFFAAALIFFSLIMLSFSYSATSRNLNEGFDPIESANKFSLLSSEELSSENISFVRDTLKKRVKKRVEEVEEVPEDLDAMIEIAYAEKSEAISAEILAGIEESLKEIEWDEINREIAEAKAELETLNIDSVMEVARIEMEKAKTELEAINMDSIMEVAKADMARDLEKLEEERAELAKELMLSKEEAMELAREAMIAAEQSLANINLDSIIEYSVNTSIEVIKELDLDKIIQEAIDDIELSIEDIKHESADLEKLEKELDELEKMK